MDKTVQCRPPPTGLFLLIDRRRLRAAGLVGLSDPILNEEHTLWPYWLNLRPAEDPFVESTPLKWSV